MRSCFCIQIRSFLGDLSYFQNICIFNERRTDYNERLGRIRGFFAHVFPGGGLIALGHLSGTQTTRPAFPGPCHSQQTHGSKLTQSSQSSESMLKKMLLLNTKEENKTNSKSVNCGCHPSLAHIFIWGRKVKVSLSHPRLFATPGTVAHQAPSAALFSVYSPTKILQDA